MCLRCRLGTGKSGFASDAAQDNKIVRAMGELQLKLSDDTSFSQLRTQGEINTSAHEGYGGLAFYDARPSQIAGSAQRAVAPIPMLSTLRFCNRLREREQALFHSLLLM